MPRKGSPYMSILNTISLESNKKIKINLDYSRQSHESGLKPHITMFLLNITFHLSSE